MGFLVLVVTFFASFGVAVYLAPRDAWLPRLAAGDVVTYWHWRRPEEPSQGGLPPLAKATLERVGRALLEKRAEELPVGPPVLKPAWARVKGVEVSVARTPENGSRRTEELLAACVHFDSAEYLKSFLRTDLDQTSPMLIQGRPVYRLASNLFASPEGGKLLLGASHTQMASLLSRRRTRETALAGQDTFRKAMRRHGSSDLLWTYVDPAGLPGWLSVLSSSARVRRLAPWLSNAPPAAADLELRPGRVVVSATAFTGAGPAGPEDSNWLSLRNTDERRLCRFVPSHADWFVAVSFDDAASFWKRFCQTASEVSPKREVGSHFQVQLQLLEEGFAVDVKKEVIPYVGREIALFGVDMGSGHASPGIVWAIELTDPKLVKRALARMEASPMLRLIRYENVLCQSEIIRAADLDEGLSYSVVADCLLASYKVKAIEAAIAALKEDESMATSPALHGLMADLPPECAVLAGANGRSLLRGTSLGSVEGGSDFGLAALTAIAQEDRLSLTASMSWRSSRPAASEGEATE